MFRALLLLCRDILRHPLPFAHDKVRHLHATRRVCMTRRVCISLPDLQTPVGWVLSSQHNPISTESTLTLESVASEGAGEGAEEGEGERQGAQGGSCSHLGKLSESGLELLKERSLLRHRVPAPFNNFNELPGGIGCDGWSLVAHLQHQDTTTLMSSRDASDGRTRDTPVTPLMSPVTPLMPTRLMRGLQVRGNTQAASGAHWHAVKEEGGGVPRIRSRIRGACIAPM